MHLMDSAHHNRRALSKLWTLAFLAAATLAFGCQDRSPDPPPPSGPRRVQAIPESDTPRPVVTLEIAERGAIRIELLPDIAPKTVDNFLKLIEEDFFTGITFHRVVPEFAIQAGDPFTKDRDPRNDGAGGPGYIIEDEFSGYSHVRGIVSMANRGYPKSAGSQFFILVEDAPPLDGKYTVFGRVISGLEVADAVSQVPRDEFGRWGPPDRPRENVVIAGIRVRDEIATTKADIAQVEGLEAEDAALAGEASSR